MEVGATQDDFRGLRVTQCQSKVGLEYPNTFSVCVERKGRQLWNDAPPRASFFFPQQDIIFVFFSACSIVLSFNPYSVISRDRVRAPIIVSCFPRPLLL